MTNTVTAVQVESMLEFLACHKDLARGTIYSVEGRAESKRLWNRLTEQLNSLGGAVKTVQQWKKVWADRKYLAKKANAAAHRSAAGTGGGPPTAPILSQNDQKVIQIMGEGFGEPDIPNARVPAFPELTVTVQSDGEELLPPVQPTPPAPDPSRLEVPDDALVDTPYVPVSRQEVPRDALPSPSVSRSRRSNLSVSRTPRRRRQVLQPDLRSRVLRLENEKKDILTGILNELKTLNSNLKNIFDKM